MEEMTVKLSILDFSALMKLFLYFVIRSVAKNLVHFRHSDELATKLAQPAGNLVYFTKEQNLTFKLPLQFGRHFLSLFHTIAPYSGTNIHLLITHISPSRLSFRYMMKSQKSISKLIHQILAKNHSRCPFLLHTCEQNLGDKLTFQKFMLRFLRCPKVVYLVHLFNHIFNITPVLNLKN